MGFRGHGVRGHGSTGSHTQTNNTPLGLDMGAWGLGDMGRLEGEQPYLGDLLTMVFNHLLHGMIPQVVTYETSFTMCGATAVSVQAHQILRLP